VVAIAFDLRLTCYFFISGGCKFYFCDASKSNLTQVFIMADKMKLGFVLSATDKMTRIVDQATRKSTESLKKLEARAEGLKKYGATGVVLAGATALVTKSFLTAAGEVERYKAVLKTMLGTTELAEKRFEEMSNFAATTPFNLNGVVEMGNQLQALGAYSKSTMTNLGDLAAASGKPIEQVVNAFAKLKSGQKGEGVNMFRDLLITNADWIKATGKGMSKNGELLASTTELLNVLPKIMKEKKFNGMMEEMSKTYEGQVSNMEDANSQLKSSIGSLILPLAKKVIPKITDFIKNIQTWSSENPKLAVGILAITGGLGLMLASIAAIGYASVYIQKGIIAFQKLGAILKLAKNSTLMYELGFKRLIIAQKLTSLWTAITTSSVWAFTAALLANPVTWVVVGIMALVAVLVLAWKKFETFRAVIKTTWEVVKGFGGILKDYVVDRIKGIITGLGSMGRAIALLFKGKFAAAGSEALKGVKALSGYDAKMNAMRKTVALTQTIVPTYTKILAAERAGIHNNEKAAIQVQKKSKVESLYSSNQSKIDNKISTTKNTQNSPALNYTYNVNINGGNSGDVDSFKKMLQDHKREITNIVKGSINNDKRVSYTSL
jgi:hypothetical protein